MSNDSQWRRGPEEVSEKRGEGTGLVVSPGVVDFNVSAETGGYATAAV